MRAANELDEAIHREPAPAGRLGPLVEKLYPAAEQARLVESEVATALTERRRGPEHARRM